MLHVYDNVIHMHVAYVLLSADQAVQFYGCAHCLASVRVFLRAVLISLSSR